MEKTRLAAVSTALRRKDRVQAARFGRRRRTAGSERDRRAVTLVRAQLDSCAMDKFVIEGGYPLSGTVVPAGNKNAALPILAASLLTDQELVIGNVPRIRDVDSMLALLEDLGVTVAWRGDHELSLRADSVTSGHVDADLASRIRA